MIKLYDMRKNFSSICIEIPEQDTSAQDSISSLSFDAYGNYLLGTYKNKLRIYSGKTWTPHQVEHISDATFDKCIFSKSSMKAFGVCKQDEIVREFSVWRIN